MKEILEELDKFFKSSFEAESGKSARKWFDHAKLTDFGRFGVISLPPAMMRLSNSSRKRYRI